MYIHSTEKYKPVLVEFLLQVTFPWFVQQTDAEHFLFGFPEKNTNYLLSISMTLYSDNMLNYAKDTEL